MEGRATGKMVEVEMTINLGKKGKQIQMNNCMHKENSMKKIVEEYDKSA